MKVLKEIMNDLYNIGMGKVFFFDMARKIKTTDSEAP